MENTFGYLVIGVIFLCLVLAFTYAVRTVSNATTPVNIIHPVEGVTCVKIVTSDGAAVDCWKDKS